MGYDKPRSLGDSAQAALYTAPIFRDFMKMALKDKPDTPFRVPPGIKLDLGRRPFRHARDRARARSWKPSSRAPARRTAMAAAVADGGAAAAPKRTAESAPGRAASTER